MYRIKYLYVFLFLLSAFIALHAGTTFLYL
jgi:hypothetical protein